MKLISLLLLATGSSCLAQSIEQQVIASSGLSGTDQYSLVHTLGEPMVVTLQEKTEVYQGFLQSIEVQKIQKNVNVSKEVIIWPNPVSQELHLKTKLLKGSYTLMNSLQQSVYQGRLQSSSEKVIDLSVYPKGVYFMHIADDKANTEVFRILKN